MKEETQGYYAGSPRLYTCTGNLGRSPRTSGVQSGGSSAGFDAYLEPGDYSGLNLGSARISIHLWHRISADDHHCLAQDRYSNLYTYDGEALM